MCDQLVVNFEPGQRRTQGRETSGDEEGKGKFKSCDFRVILSKKPSPKKAFLGIGSSQFFLLLCFSQHLRVL